MTPGSQNERTNRMTRSGPHFLQIPGPTNVPGRVLRAIERPTMDHRGPDFGRLGAEVLEGVKKVFKTESSVVIFLSSSSLPSKQSLDSEKPRVSSASSKIWRAAG